jgi:hypothetical protein
VTESAIATPRAWWHGCWLESGHYLHDRSGDSGRAVVCPVRAGRDDAYWLDGGLAPRRVQPGVWLQLAVPDDGVVFTRMAGNEDGLRQRIERSSGECDQGEFLLHAVAGCTIAAWWDRTQGDTRPACNSCLIVDGGHSANEMLELFPRLFPVQAARLVAAGVALRFLRWGQP